MRGTLKPHRGICFHSFRLVNLFPLVALLAASALFSGCASVAGSSDSRIAAKISVVPETVQFREVVVGQENSQTLRVTNTSTEPIRLDALRISGNGFSLGSERNPAILIPGQSVHFTVGFKPVTAAPVAGALEISSADLGTLNVPLEGSGEKAAPLLEASPNALNFGVLPVHGASSQAVILKNAGNVAISISSVSLPSASYSLSGLASGTALSPGQTLQFRVTFQPSAPGAASSGITINSSALSSPVKLAVSGSGSNTASGSSTSSSTTTTSSSSTPPASTSGSSNQAGSTSSTPTSSSPAAATPPSVKLSWDASNNSVAGYHIYRGSASGGPYSRISGSLSALGYEDTTVQAGSRYYYVVSAVDSSGDESAYSNEATADVPNQ